MNRRNFIGSMLAAPAIVRAELLMPVTKIWTPRAFAFRSPLEWREACNAIHVEGMQETLARYNSIAYCVIKP